MPETLPWHMPLATVTSARGASATVRTNTLAAGWGDSLGKGDWELGVVCSLCLADLRFLSSSSRKRPFPLGGYSLCILLE